MDTKTNKNKTISFLKVPFRKGPNKRFFLGFILILSFFFFLKPNISQAVNLPLPIPNTSIDSTDSEQLPTYAAAYAVDGNNATFWHPQYIGTIVPNPHNIVIDLGKDYLIEGLKYLPRQDGSTYGIITSYEIYTSADKIDWTEAIANGTFTGNSSEKEILFSNRTGRYVKFVSLSDMRNSTAASVAEIKILGFNADGSAIETPPIVTQGSPLPIPNTSIDSTDSEQLPTYAAAYAVDGNNATFWHPQYIGTIVPNPHNIVIDLGKDYLIEGLKYLPRQDGSTYGIITSYEIYTSADKIDWTEAIANGTFTGNSSEKEILFSNRTGRYVKFVSLSDMRNSTAASVAEIKILGFNADGSAVEEIITPQEIPPISSVVSINSFDSQQLPNYPATASIDGNASTFWHTQYIGPTTPHPHQITLDLGNSYPVDGFRYLPRQDGYLFGTITRYELYVSDNISNWGAAVSTGTFASNATLKEISFTAKTGRYVKLVSLADAMGSVAAAAAEIQAIGTGIPNKEITYANLSGPEISVGLWSYTKDSLNETPFKVEANKKYNIKNSAGSVIASVENNIITRVSYVSDKNFKVYNSIPEILINKEVIFESADGNNSDMIFDIYRPLSTYDQYRGKIKIRYTDSNNIWVINTLPMEHYVWGMGETTGTGPFEHTKLMTMIFRTYGYQYITWTSTIWVPYGFRIRSDSGSQIYRGYDWETTYPNIKLAAENTRGKIVTYNGEVALTPYSSWTDGRTRSFQERWGSTDYPWCRSVSDPYGKHPTMTTAQLEAAGNHMVGVSANGSVKLAGSSYNKTYDWILKYYYTGIDISSKY